MTRAILTLISLLALAGSASAQVPAPRYQINSTNVAGSVGYFDCPTGACTYSASTLRYSIARGAGGLTSLTAGTGITLTPSPITTTGTVALTIPVAVASGGTNATSGGSTGAVAYWAGTSYGFTAAPAGSGTVLIGTPAAAPTFTAALTLGTSITAPSYISESMYISSTAPAVSAGFGAGATVTAHNGTIAFRIAVGTTATSSGVIALPTAANGWNCWCSDLTTHAGSCQQQSSTQTTATIAQYNSLSVLLAWTDNDVLAVSCVAY